MIYSKHSHRKNRHRSRMGVSILEVVISAAILGSVGVLAMNGISATYRSQLDTSDFARADLLARDLMDEILQQEFEAIPNVEILIEPGDTTRTTFYHLDQYDNWNSDSSQPPQTKNGLLLGVGSGWSRAVNVDSVSIDNIDLDNGADTGIKRVVVVVGRNGRKLITETAYSTRHSGDLSSSRD